jgi:hypothetical protein
LKICWTNLWRNTYGSLFKNVSTEHSPHQSRSDVVPIEAEERGEIKTAAFGPPPIETGSLLFKWAPEMKGLITPSPSVLPVTSDGWAFHKGYVSVTPLRASLGEPHSHQSTAIEDRIWKIKL